MGAGDDGGGAYRADDGVGRIDIACKGGGARNVTMSSPETLYPSTVLRPFPGALMDARTRRTVSREKSNDEYTDRLEE